MRVSRAGLLCLALSFAALPSSLALADEGDTAKPAPMPAPSWEIGAGALATDGNERRVMELLRSPSSFWATTAVDAPFDAALGWGTFSLSVTTLGTGAALVCAHLASGGHVKLRLRRDRTPFAPRARSTQAPLADDADVLADLETSHEQLLASFAQPLGRLGGRVELTLDLDRRAGERPALPAGLARTNPLDWAFGNPAYRTGNDRSLRVGLDVAAVVAGVAWELDGALWLERLREDLIARDRSDATATGSLRMRDKDSRTAVEVGLSAATAKPRALLLGGRYALVASTADPTTSRVLDQTGGVTGTAASDDIDVTSVRHRAALGATWLPRRWARLAAQLVGGAARHTRELTEQRDVGTARVVSGSAKAEPMDARGRLDASFALRPWLWLEGRADATLQRGDDDWSQTFLLPDLVTSVGQRAKELERERRAAAADLHATVRTADTRVLVGVAASYDDRDVDALRRVDAVTLGDRRRDRGTGYVRARTRVRHRTTLEAALSVFRERLEAGGEEPRHDGLDARLRLSSTIGPLSVHGAAALSDDRYDVSQRSDLAPAGFAPVEFHGRVIIVTAAAAWAHRDAELISATYNLVATAADLDSTLEDATLRLSLGLPRSLRLSLGARFLRFEDAHASWDNGTAVAGFALVGGWF